MVARRFDRCQVAIDIDTGGHHHPPPLQVIITSPRSVGVPLVGTLTISNITPIVNVMFLISSAVLDRESLHSRQELSIGIYHRTTYSSICAVLQTSPEHR
jgi:hypothetical protein